MTTRRTFLVGASAALTVPIVSNIEWFIEAYGRPLIEPPCNSLETLYIYPDYDNQITLGPQSFDAQKTTWGEYVAKMIGKALPTRASELDLICEDLGVDPTKLDLECDSNRWYDYWAYNHSPNATAYHLLDGLDLGPELRGGPGEVGSLSFVDGAAPGVDYLGVHVDDYLSISLLQHRLNVIGERIAIEVVT